VARGAPLPVVFVPAPPTQGRWGPQRSVHTEAAASDPPRHPEFAGNVLTVNTRDYWRSPAQSPNNQGHHYNGNAETYMLVGDALGQAMVKLLKGKK